MDPKPLRLRVTWTQPVPSQWQGVSTEFGMQQGRDVLLPGTLQPDGTTAYETDVTAYMDAKGRLRFRGACIQGKPEEPFVYLSWRVPGSATWVMRAKVMLSHLVSFIATLSDGATLQTSVHALGGRPRDHVQLWVAS